MSLEDPANPQIALDVFKEDPNFQENEKKYEVLHPSSTVFTLLEYCLSALRSSVECTCLSCCLHWWLHSNLLL